MNSRLAPTVCERHTRPTDGTRFICQIKTPFTILQLLGVLPDAKYSVRVAGQYGNVTGPFTEWLRVRTLPYNSSSTDVRVYYVSAEEVLLSWKPFVENVETEVEVLTDLDTLSLSKFYI